MTHSNPAWEIDVSFRCPADDVDARYLKTAVETALRIEQVSRAVLSITLVDDDTIRRIHRDHLQKDCPTDVISFPLDWQHPSRRQPAEGESGRSAGAAIEGEIVAGLEWARRAAGEHGWPVQTELTLYVIHGMLHICGYDDLVPQEKRVMQARESAVFRALGYHCVPGRTVGSPSLSGETSPQADSPSGADASKESAG